MINEVESNSVAVIIGRFQPLHNNHLHLFIEAAKYKYLIVVLGSCNRIDFKNPFSIAQREQMISDYWSTISNKPIYFIHANDYPYSDRMWEFEIYRAVSNELFGNYFTLIGTHSDDSSYYLNLFPNWKKVFKEHKSDFHASDLRPYIFHQQLHYLINKVPNSTYSILCSSDPFNTNYSHKDYLAQMEKKNEYSIVRSKDNKYMPWDPIFPCVDAVVVYKNKILTVKREDNGKLALPGGHLNADERYVNGILRELKEETNLSLTVNMVKKIQDFDSPGRSPNRKTSKAFLFELEDSFDVSEVRAGDDAIAVAWFDYYDIWRFSKIGLVHEDHLDIINYMYFNEKLT